DDLTYGKRYQAWVTWGDGGESAAVVYGSGTALWVGGNHAYANPGLYLAVVRIWEDGAPDPAWETRTEVRVDDLAEGDEYPARAVGVARVEPANDLDDLRAWVGWGNGQPELLDFGGLQEEGTGEAVLGV